jgi:hypothetical protein
MRIIGYTALHYGRDYFSHAIRSIIHDVDELWVLYTAQGSHGHRTSIPCPETRAELYAIAQQAAGDKLRWIDGSWTHEGQQRDSIHQYAPDADVVVVLDSDEIWTPGLLPSVIQWGLHSHARNIRVPFRHYWRSLHRAILHDPAFPTRVIFPKRADGYETYNAPPWIRDGEYVIHHFGYAQRPEIIQYKLLTHGHRGEFRRDCNWYTDIFMLNRQYDNHPVGSSYWNCEDATPPEILQDHPYYGLKVIT